jgi:flagellar biosynthesis/type III secretory pathway M-ring protein FliF/YscJ
MIEIARVILWWILHALLWGSEFILVALLMAWLYYVIVIEPRIRRKKQTIPVAETDQAAPTTAGHRGENE